MQQFIMFLVTPVFDRSKYLLWKKGFIQLSFCSTFSLLVTCLGIAAFRSFKLLEACCLFDIAIASLLGKLSLNSSPRFTAAEGLPRWAESRHRHAPEQGAAPAAPVRVGQQGLPALPLPHYQDLLLRPGRVPHPAGGRSAGHLLRLLGVHGGPEGQHCAGHTGWVRGAGWWLQMEKFTVMYVFYRDMVQCASLFLDVFIPFSIYLPLSICICIHLLWWWVFWAKRKNIRTTYLLQFTSTYFPSIIKLFSNMFPQITTMVFLNFKF